MGHYITTAFHKSFGFLNIYKTSAYNIGACHHFTISALLAHYREKAAERGRTFSTENTVSAVQEMLNTL